MLCSGRKIGVRRNVLAHVSGRARHPEVFVIGDAAQVAVPSRNLLGINAGRRAGHSQPRAWTERTASILY